MAGKEVKFKDKSKKRKRNEQSELAQNVHGIVQIMEMVFVLLLVFLAVTSPFQILNIHVTQMTIGWMVSMTQGLLVFRGINPMFSKIFGNDTVFIHWVLETIALIGATVGFTMAYLDRNAKNKDHFGSWHSLLGLIGYALGMWASVNGTITLYKKELRRFLPVKWVKFGHICTGTASFFFGGLSLICACYTNWFASRTSSSVVTFTIALILVTSVVTWTLVRPIQKIRGNWIKLMSKE